MGRGVGDCTARASRLRSPSFAFRVRLRELANLGTDHFLKFECELTGRSKEECSRRESTAAALRRRVSVAVDAERSVVIMVE